MTGIAFFLIFPDFVLAYVIFKKKDRDLDGLLLQTDFGENKLSALAELVALNFSKNQHHNAQYDAEICGFIFFKMNQCC